MIHTILGSGGAIGTPLAQALTGYTKHIRLVARNPQKVNPDDELMSADLTDPAAVDRAIEGSEVVYVVIGFQYSTKVWKRTWPPFMKSVLVSCRKHNARLVFFDNVYLYAKEAIPHMTEQSVIDPPSQKGKIRAHLVSMINEAIEQGQPILIARAPDFYGPGKVSSTLTETVVKNLRKGKKAIWIGNADAVHQFIFTPDAGRAVALLGNTPEAFGQVWHLPTHNAPLTIRHWASLFARAFQTPYRLTVIPPFMLRVLGLFIPIMAELAEMNYQNEQDYRFDSSKFIKAFPEFVITSPEKGVASMTGKDEVKIF